MPIETIKINGVENINRALYSYSQQLGDRAMLGSLRLGAYVIRKAISKKAPIYTGPDRHDVVKGALRRGFRVYKSKIHNGKMSNSLVGVYVRIRRMKKNTGGRGTEDPFYARWQNYGWNVRGKSKGQRSTITAAFGSRTGRKSQPGRTTVPGKFFIQRAFESSKHQAVNVSIRAIKISSEVIKRKVGLR